MYSSLVTCDHVNKAVSPLSLSLSLSPSSILGRSEDGQWVAEGVTQQEVEEAEDSKEFEGTRWCEAEGECVTKQIITQPLCERPRVELHQLPLRMVFL